MTASGFEDKMKSAADDAGAFVGGAARRAGAAAGEIGEQAYAGGARVARSLARQAQDQSTAALLIAGAVGAALGYLIARR